MYDIRALDKAWSELPDAGIPPLRARWIAPLVDRGLDGWIGEMSQGAYGINENCGWLQAIENLPPMFDDRGRVSKAWMTAICEAANLLAQAGSYSGPESSVERWTSWLLWELAEPHEWLKDRLSP